MGQRSQIFVRYNKEEGKKHIIARYYQWKFDLIFICNKIKVSLFDKIEKKIKVVKNNV